MVDSYQRFIRSPKRSFFLFGMRGVGKSTWARATFPKANYVDLLDERLYQDLLADPSLFAQSIADLKVGDWVVVDEVQRLPALLNEVHRLIEAHGLRFALLGSSARKLKAAGTNLLAGRALKKTMFPLTAAELGEEFDLDRVLQYGSVPLVWSSGEPREVLEAYGQLYLREEIRAEALVRNLPGFVRFLSVAALFNGQLVNVAGIARDAGVSRTTVQGYLDILEDTLLAYRLPAYETRTRVRERKRPKLYWVDPGVVRAVKRQLGPPTAEERGSLLESWVATTLQAHAETQHLYDELSYWAPHQSTVEVDFLLQRDGELLAIEVKATGRYHTSLLKGLRALGPLPGLVRRILVYTGERSFKSSDGVEIWPAHRFAMEIAGSALWPRSKPQHPQSLSPRGRKLFDTHIVVDWSARSTRSGKRPQENAIWWAVARDGKTECRYHRTRHEAIQRLGDLLAIEAEAGRRVLVGFDFPFGYPAGVAEHLTGHASAFELWGWLTERIEDRSDNSNNRYEVAEEINRHYPGVGPCWGRPTARRFERFEDVPMRKRGRTYREAHPPEHRVSDKRAKGAKTLWQLAYAGSVGSQALLGIPALAGLKEALGDQVSVWPLDTGLELPHTPIVFAEVYPSLLREAVAARREHDEILDRAQVRINALAFSLLDSQGGLAPLFGGAPELTSEERRIVETEEALMLGLGHENALLAALAG